MKSTPFKDLTDMKKMESPMCAAALGYVEKFNWKVFPARMEHGRKYSWLSAEFAPGHENWGMSNDPEQVRKNFSRPRWRDKCGVGIPTGAVNGIFVVDVDTVAGHGVDGIGAMRKLQREHGRLPKTRRARSPSGSVHYYFRHPGDGIKIVSRAIAPGIDCKGDGGQVAAPPSKNSSGGKYRWLNSLPIATAPRWLLAIVQETPREVDPFTQFANSTRQQASIEELRLATAMIPNPDHDWDTWNKAGMALFSATGGSIEGFKLFDAFSKRSRKYDAATTLAKWKALHGCPPREIGAGTILYLAEQSQPDWKSRIRSRDPKVIKLLREFHKLLGEP
jgi:Bifunctional DNA primase/polymerase, N-terminal/Primase C terminal 2 (PriCT-2)